MNYRRCLTRAITAVLACLLCLAQSGPVWSAAPGTLVVTGHNDWGQMGQGDQQDKLRPMTVGSLTNIVTAVGGRMHTLALTSEGKVWGIGGNGDGQLGIGTYPSIQLVPVAIASLSGITALAAGDYHSLALKSDGTVWAWGLNTNGQVGNGTLIEASQPVQVSGLSGITAIATGKSHSLALKSNGTVWAWGLNANGRLGDGTTTDRSTPVQVSGLSGVTAISGGSLHSLALKSNGTVWAWGSNTNGVLGDGSGAAQPLPVQASSLSSITAIASGAAHNLARKSDGTVWAWGQNAFGQLGDTTETTRTTAVQVLNVAGIAAIACGGSHSLALKSDGTVLAWGHGFYGALGNGGTADRSQALPIESISAALSISAGGSSSLITVGPTNNGFEAVDDHAIVYRNSSTAQTINVLVNDFSIQNATFSVTSNTSAAHGTVVNSSNAVTYAPTTGFTGEDSFSYTITDSQGHSSTASVKVFVIRRGTILTWGWNTNSILGDGTYIDRFTPVPVVGLTGNIVQLSGGATHCLVVKSDGTVWGWGGSVNVETGSGSGGRFPWTAVQVPGISDVKFVAAGRSASLALKNDGTVWSWGWNSRGELGDGTTTRRGTPQPISGLTNVKAIAMTGGHGMALKNDGTVWTWGENVSGQLGDGTATKVAPFGKLTPLQVPGLSGVTAIASGDDHSLALKSDGTVWAWGDNYWGEIGIGADSYHEQLSPIAVPNLSGITKITVDGSHNAASGSGSTTWGWGRNNESELIGGTVRSQRVPAPIPGVESSDMLAWGEMHGLALGTDGRLRTWGNNDHGQLGDGTRIARGAPTPLDGLSDVTLIAAGLFLSLAKASVSTDPIATGDAFSVSKNSGANALNVLGNDQPGDSPLSITTVTQGTHGSVAITGGGSGLTYTPAAGYTGTDSFTYSVDGGEAPATVTITVVPTYDVTGRVATSSGTGLANVAIAITPVPAGLTSPATTNASGNYTLANIPAGTYTLTPSVTGYSFTPATRTVTVSGTNVAGQDFIAIPWASLGGTIKDASNVAVSGALVTISPVPAGVTATITTNAGGAYSFARVPPGTYTLTPVRSGNSFNPGTRGITVATANIANLNFTAGPGYTITGRIAWSNGVGMANVRVTRTQSTTPIYTNASGYFTFTGVPNGSYQITPSLAPYSMLPAYTVAVVNGANVGNINFTGGYTINGRIYNSAGAAIVNVSVLRTGSPYPVYTNTAGYYTFGGVAPGTYTVTPTLAGYGFAPQTRSMTITDANSVNQNFVASSGYILSGRVMTSTGAAIPNVIVTRSGSTLTAMTNSSGYYTFTGVPNGVYTVTPTLTGKTFAPVNKSVTVSGANVGNQNFIGSGP